MTVESSSHASFESEALTAGSLKIADRLPISGREAKEVLQRIELGGVYQSTWYNDGGALFHVLMCNCDAERRKWSPQIPPFHKAVVAIERGRCIKVLKSSRARKRRSCGFVV